MLRNTTPQKYSICLSTRQSTFSRCTTLMCIGLLVLLAACDTSELKPQENEAPSVQVIAGADGEHFSSKVNGQLGHVRAATARFHRTAAAQAAGYDLVPGLDHCFTNQPIGDMGFHYIDTAALDLTLDLLHPEAMVYAPGPNGKLKLGAVEYIVPAADWDAQHAELPMMLDRHLHLNEALGVYVLHAWIWRHNRSGLFEDWNPDVTCP